MTAATNQDVETQFLRVSSHGSKTIKCCTDQDQITRETFNNVTHLQVVDLGTFNWPLLLLTQSTSVVWSQSKQSLPSEPHGIYHQTFRPDIHQRHETLFVFCHMNNKCHPEYADIWVHIAVKHSHFIWWLQCTVSTDIWYKIVWSSAHHVCCTHSVLAYRNTHVCTTKRTCCCLSVGHHLIILFYITSTKI